MNIKELRERCEFLEKEYGPNRKIYLVPGCLELNSNIQLNPMEEYIMDNNYIITPNGPIEIKDAIFIDYE